VRQLVIKKNFNNIKMHGTNVEIMDAQHPALCNRYKNAKLKSFETNAAILFNLLTPNVNYNGRTAPLTSKVAFCIFIQQI